MMKNQSQTTTRVETTTLSPLEENVVRMRHGLKAPSDLQLDSKAGENQALAAQLAEIEKRALEAAGARSNSTKSKIVDQLRRKG